MRDHAPVLFRSAALIAVAVAGASCCEGPVDFVEFSIFAGGSGGHESLAIGDTTTIWAAATTFRGTGCVLYQSRVDSTRSDRVEPWMFEFSSSDTTVATLDSLGHVTTRAAGETFLRATTLGVSSLDLLLIVSPRIHSIVLGITASNVRVGDTVALHVAAYDQEDREVTGALVRTRFTFPGETVATWTQESAPIADGPSPTPYTVRFRAQRPGELRIVAYGLYQIGGGTQSNVVQVAIAPR